MGPVRLLVCVSCGWQEQVGQSHSMGADAAPTGGLAGESRAGVGRPFRFDHVHVKCAFDSHVESLRDVRETAGRRSM